LIGTFFNGAGVFLAVATVQLCELFFRAATGNALLVMFAVFRSCEFHVSVAAILFASNRVVGATIAFLSRLGYVLLTALK